MNNDKEIKEILSMEELFIKIPNAEQRYQEDALFNIIINDLIWGADPIQLLGEVLRIRKETSDTLEDLLKNGLPPQKIILSTEQFDILTQQTKEES